MQTTEAELAAMHRALALAETARGRTSPNPPVGAVVLAADGSLAGEGITAPVGGPHAEVVALAEAGAAARG
ncbi:MAG: diaminohydroxyphosphoribosylaminopyrimidine deaminase, partial [Pseudonocardiales bacterium]|nr:diaminohydroxyphosphoribosylaminopyrimidine deaminase [Pseudonocardiales bacterium]